MSGREGKWQWKQRCNGNKGVAREKGSDTYSKLLICCECAVLKTILLTPRPQTQTTPSQEPFPASNPSRYRTKPLSCWSTLDVFPGFRRALPKPARLFIVSRFRAYKIRVHGFRHQGLPLSNDGSIVPA